MKVVVCGSVGYGEIEKIKELQRFLSEKGFDVIDQFKDADYSYIKDFRNDLKLCEKIVKSDLRKIEEADVLILIADIPSFGSAIEAYNFSMSGKPVIAYAEGDVRSPWPLFFSKKVCKSKDELVEVLKSIEVKEIKVIRNVYGNHEAEFKYKDFKCICPVTGEVDKAEITIRYEADKWLIEYECLDDYFKKFENKRIHHEGVVNTIFNDVLIALKPKRLEVEAKFEERSNVKAKIRKSNF